MSDGFYAQQQGAVAIHTFTDSTNAAVDSWATELARHIDTTPPDQPFRVLMDVSSNNVSFTRHARQTTVQLFTRFQNRSGRFAFLFSSRTAPYFARIFFATLGKLGFEIAYFSNRTKALEWLNES
jgi:hypothetical protein